MDDVNGTVRIGSTEHELYCRRADLWSATHVGVR